MNSYRYLIIFGVVMAIITPFAIWYEMTVWRECLADHPWWYCLRIIGK